LRFRRRSIGESPEKRAKTRHWLLNLVRVTNTSAIWRQPSPRGDVAEEMERRAYILAHGKEDDYRPLMLKKYGINNPELNKIAAYYAEKFNDQATLNWLKLQHPYVRSRKDDLNAIESMAMMLMGGLVTDLDGAPQEGAGSVPIKAPLIKPLTQRLLSPRKDIFRNLAKTRQPENLGGRRLKLGRDWKAR
jgi:hypothetical protein